MTRSSTFPGQGEDARASRHTPGDSCEEDEPHCPDGGWTGCCKPGMGRTAAQKRAIEGNASHPADALLEPLTAQEMSAGQWWWTAKVNSLAAKLKKLSPNAPQKNRDYMRAKLAKLRGIKLAFGFLFQTSCRLNTVHNLAACLQGKSFEPSS